MTRTRQWFAPLGGPILVLAIIVTGPWILPSSIIGIGTLCAAYLVAGVGLNVLLGYTQQVSFGQGGFWAIGAYSVGILTLKVGMPVLAAVVLAVVITGLISAVVGWPMTQLRGHYIAVATLAFALIVAGVANNWVGLTGGPVGLPNIPSLSLFGRPIVGADLYRAAWIVVLVVLVITANLSKSRVGRAFRAVGADDAGSQALGVPSGSYRLRAFVFAGTLAGLGGAMYVLYIPLAAPDAFGPDLSALLLVVLMVGGMRSTYGALVGAIVVTALTQFLTNLAASPSMPANLAPAINILVYGILILIVMRFAPRGLLPVAADGARAVVNRLHRRPLGPNDGQAATGRDQGDQPGGPGTPSGSGEPRPAGSLAEADRG